MNQFSILNEILHEILFIRHEQTRARASLNVDVDVVFMTQQQQRQHVTLQIGHSSNFIAQHMWNTHIANLSTTTTTGTSSTALDDQHRPLSVVVDVAHSFGRLSFDTGTVTNETHVHSTALAQQPSVPPVLEFTRRHGPVVHTNVDNRLDTLFWSDFALHRYRVGSLHALHQHQLATLSSSEFAAFATGERVWSRHAEADELDDRLRRLLELCDRVDAVTALVDVDDAFGGVAAHYLARLRDELPSSVPVFAVALLNRAPPLRRPPPAPCVVAGARLLSLNAIQQHVSLFTVVSPLTVQCAFAPSATNVYRTAALLALPIEAFLSGTRRNAAHSYDASSIAGLLARGRSRHCVALRSHAPLVPFGAAEQPQQLLQSLTPSYGQSWTYAPQSPVYSVTFAGAAAVESTTVLERFATPLALPRSFPAHASARVASTCVHVEAGAPTLLDTTLGVVLDDAGRAERVRLRDVASDSGVETDEVVAAIADIENTFDL
jgi:hypothetical protein